MAWRRPGAQQRRGTPADFLVLGLANPGAHYAHTRHNVGADAVRIEADRRGGTFKIEPRQRAELCEVNVGDARLALAIPTTYMNESGAALPGLIERTGLASPERLLVVHDELDLEPGRLQLKVGGGIAGHNGLRSIKNTLDTADFLRLRIGVGKPPSKEAGANWVLSRPKGEDAELLRVALALAADVIEVLVADGVDRAMMLANTRG